jgi:hypothetical protein
MCSFGCPAELTVLVCSPYAADENIYLALAGLEGAGERPLIEIGQERMEAYDRALDSIRLNPASALELNRQWDAAKLKVQGKVEELGHPRTSSIWMTTKTHRLDILAKSQGMYSITALIRRRH